MTLKKVVSGGQTGVDRAALDAALSAHFPCGGWCPENRMAEDGPIPEHYPLEALAGAGFRARTRQNVIDSDGTLILFDGTLTGGEPTGGSQLTLNTARAKGKPLLVIDASKVDAASAAQAVLTWLLETQVSVINVAGPRASGWSGGYVYALDVIKRLLPIRAARTSP
jgi:hypothetical protein